MPMQKTVFAVGALVALGGAFANAAAPPQEHSFVQDQSDRPFEDETWEFGGQYTFLNPFYDFGLTIPDPETSDLVVAESYVKASKEWGGSISPIEKYTIQIYRRDEGSVERIYLRNGPDGEFRRLSYNTTANGTWCRENWEATICHPKFDVYGLGPEEALPEGFTDEFDLRSYSEEEYDNNETFGVKLQKKVGDKWHVLCAPEFVPVGDNKHFSLWMLDIGKNPADKGMRWCSFTFARVMKTEDGMANLFNEFLFGGTYILFNKKYGVPIKPFQFDDAAGALVNVDQWGPQARLEFSVFNKNTWMVGIKSSHHETRSAYRFYGGKHDYLDVADHTFKLGVNHYKSKPDKVFQEPGAKLHVVVSPHDNNYWAFRNSYDSYFMRIHENLLNDQGVADDSSSWHILKIVANPIRHVSWAKYLPDV